MRKRQAHKFQAHKWYNKLPLEMRQFKKMKFKKEVKKWTKENVPIR